MAFQLLFNLCFILKFSISIVIHLFLPSFLSNHAIEASSMNVVSTWSKSTINFAIIFDSSLLNLQPLSCLLGNNLCYNLSLYLECTPSFKSWTYESTRTFFPTLFCDSLCWCWVIIFKPTPLGLSWFFLLTILMKPLLYLWAKLLSFWTMNLHQLTPIYLAITWLSLFPNSNLPLVLPSKHLFSFFSKFLIHVNWWTFPRLQCSTISQ